MPIASYNEKPTGARSRPRAGPTAGRVSHWTWQPTEAAGRPDPREAVELGDQGGRGAMDGVGGPVAEQGGDERSENVRKAQTRDRGGPTPRAGEAGGDPRIDTEAGAEDQPAEGGRAEGDERSRR